MLEFKWSGVLSPAFVSNSETYLFVDKDGTDIGDLLGQSLSIFSLHIVTLVRYRLFNLSPSPGPSTGSEEARAPMWRNSLVLRLGERSNLIRC